MIFLHLKLKGDIYEKKQIKNYGFARSRRSNS